ncbi:HD domain-containing protein [Geobacter sp. SVR]|uniref:HD domain-containing protein n=1 Tax=Geobacter sp. SVR TaxID=2495594 RepID=UPI00143EFFFF|nr:HD domain-containing protein [Geobacter sp. SVR]BCS54079.1 hypothetical protein GSVR_23870 [Geobacter sp. SVR]GCF87562.1 hypothetical protein GSbR_41620 [Geobacter sp. SVR]
MQTNSEYFEPSYAWFKFQVNADFVRKAVDMFPPYFAEKPASSTGKYHATWSNMKGGLRAHTLAVAYMTHSLSDAYMLDDREHDAALIAALFHDAVKYGFGCGPHTSKTHESEGAIFFKRVADRLNYPNALNEQIYTAIAFHQGRWAVCDPSKIFPDDFGKIGQLVHIADMVASRPEVRFNFLETSLIG